MVSGTTKNTCPDPKDSKEKKDTQEKKDTRQMLVDYIARKIAGEKTDVGFLAVSLISAGIENKEDETLNKLEMPEDAYFVRSKEEALGGAYYIPEVTSLLLDREDDMDTELEDIALAVASEHLYLGAGKTDLETVFHNRVDAVAYYSREITRYLQIKPDDCIAQGVAAILQAIS